MADDDKIDQLFTIARHQREDGGSFVPLIFWSRAEMDLAASPIPSNGIGIVGDITDIVDRMRGDLGVAEWVAVILDAYGRPAEQGPTGADLGSDFRAGAANVVEQLMLLYGQPHTPTRVYRQVYRYTPIDGWEWNEIELMLNPVLPDRRLLYAVRGAVTPHPV